jgi:hypothetical protein
MKNQYTTRRRKVDRLCSQNRSIHLVVVVLNVIECMRVGVRRLAPVRGEVREFVDNGVGLLLLIHFGAEQLIAVLGRLQILL